ncbi:MAG: LysM peptidoglycan-binding domain-containing protein [Actinomycetota bacterium]
MTRNRERRDRAAWRAAARGLALSAAAGLPLLWLGPVDRSSLTTLAGPDPAVALAALATVIAWLLWLWLVAAVAASLLAALPRRAGHGARQGVVVLAAPPAPVAVLAHSVAVARDLGGPAGEALSNPASLAPDAGPRPDLAGPLLDRPSTAGADTAAGWVPAPPPTPTVPRPATPALLTPTPRPLPAAEPTEVVVRRGDSLWHLAAHHLGPGATVEQIAREWPRWWQANRDVIGDDPDLLRVGLRLQVPA